MIGSYRENGLEGLGVLGGLLFHAGLGLGLDFPDLTGSGLRDLSAFNGCVCISFNPEFPDVSAGLGSSGDLERLRPL